MTLFSNLPAVIMLSAILVLHLFNFILPGIYAKILGYVNVALHIALVFPFLFGNVEVKDAALAYMISAFLYILFAFIFYRLRRRRDDV